MASRAFGAYAGRVRRICAFASGFVGLLGTGGCAGTSGAGQAAPTLAPPDVPPAVAVPSGAHLAVRFHAVGAQVYACAPAADGTPGWVLKRPDAKLSGDDGQAAGTHGAGPSWTHTDGSTVTGKKLAQADAPQASAVPWLLLAATSTAGSGVFANVTFVQRVATAGGKAPAEGCASDTVGTELRVPYSADYYFYRGGNS